jgi:hypothetical protein
MNKIYHGASLAKGLSRQLKFSVLHDNLDMPNVALTGIIFSAFNRKTM